MTIKTFFAAAAMLLAAATALPTQAADEKQPAFPGAEGYARYITGGRGGKVLYVTKLTDDGSTGTLRWAVEQKGARTIMFKVSGNIFLNSELTIKNGDLTIAGQSAPGDGICIGDYPVSIRANNVIVRYMRFRLGNINVKKDGADGWDGFGAMDQQDIMIDHCSVSWSIDECLSLLGNKNTTVQWCISSHSLVNAGHTKGAHGYGGNWGGDHASFHHNLIAHHASRTPRLGPRPTTQLNEHMDMRNNVIYNWGGNGCYGGEGMDVNIVNNYYKPGPATLKKSTTIQQRIASIGTRTTSYVTTYPDYAPALHKWGHFFVEGNTNSKWASVTNNNWAYGIYQQIDTKGNDGTYTSVTKDTIKLTEPLSFIYTTTHTADVAYEKVLSYVGCSLSRDAYDAELIDDVRNGTASHTGDGLDPGQINSQDDLTYWGDDGAWPTLASKVAPADQDGDGMPDNWEDNNNLDATDPSDGAKIAKNGYTNLENYLNSIVAKITAAQNADGEALGDVQTVGGSEEEPDAPQGYKYEEVATGSVNWTVTSSTSNTTFGKNPTVSAEIKDYVKASDVAFGSALSAGARNNFTAGPDGAQSLVRIATSKRTTLAEESNTLTYTVTPNSGYYFKPTAVVAYVNKVGTDGGTAEVNIANDAQTERVYLGSPSRNSVDASKGYNNYTKASADNTPLAPSSGVTRLTVSLYSYDTSKQMSVGTCSVTGIVYRLVEDGPSVLLGDVDGDKSVTMADANMVVNYYLGVPVTGFNLKAADMDGDGSITMADANAIVNIYLGAQ